MIVSAGFLATLVTLATLVATFTPVILLVLFLRDRARGSLW